jgi:hypothetical protein
MILNSILGIYQIYQIYLEFLFILEQQSLSSFFLFPVPIIFFSWLLHLPFFSIPSQPISQFFSFPTILDRMPLQTYDHLQYLKHF